MSIKKERFLKIPIDQWKYELESGEISWDEHSVREWLWLKANPITGKVAVNYGTLAEELKGRFSYVKDLVNKLSKIMISLKKKQRLWFKEHSGSRGPVEVELQDFPLINRQYTDISHRFQQSSSRGPAELTSQNGDQQAELSEVEQSLEGSKSPENERETKDLDSDSSRGPKRDKDKEEEEREMVPSSPLSSSFPSPEKDGTGKEEGSSGSEINREFNESSFLPSDSWGVWEYFRYLVLRTKGTESPDLSRKADLRIKEFLNKYGGKKAIDLINFYFNSEECKKDRKDMGLNLATIFGEYIIGKWINSFEDEESYE